MMNSLEKHVVALTLSAVIVLGMTEVVPSAAGTRETVGDCGNTPGTSSILTTGAPRTVSKKALTASLTPKDREYDGTTNVSFEAFGTGSLSGVAAGEDVSIESVTASVADKNTSDTPKAVTVSSITLTGADAGNYEVSPLPTGLSVKISKRALTAAPGADQKKTFGESDPAQLSYTVTSGAVVTGEMLSQVLARESGENVGSYAIKKHPGADTANPNYAITVPEGMNFTINKASRLSGKMTVYVQENDLGGEKSVDLTRLSFQVGGNPVGADRLGSISYAGVSATSNGLLSRSPAISGTTLSYSLAGSAAPGLADDITVTVRSTNYEDAAAVIHVELSDKIVPGLSGTVKDSAPPVREPDTTAERRPKKSKEDPPRRSEDGFRPLLGTCGFPHSPGRERGNPSRGRGHL